MHLMGCRTIKDIPVKPIDRSTIWQKIGVIYRYKHGRMDCKKEYIGESGRTFTEGYKEHIKAPSPITAPLVMIYLLAT